MKRFLFLLPAVLAFQVSAPPALAWTWPADGPVLREFQFGNDPYASGQHRGIDIQARDGTAVLAPASGVVTFGGTVPTGGRTLTIETASGYAVTLLHLGTISARKGESVVEGAVVGTAGRSGAPEHDAVYVHLGVRVVGERHGYVDPRSLLPPRAGDGTPATAANESAEASQPPTPVGQESAGDQGGSVSPNEATPIEPVASTSSAGLAVEIPEHAYPPLTGSQAAVDVSAAAPTSSEPLAAKSEPAPSVPGELLDGASPQELETADPPAAASSSSPADPAIDAGGLLLADLPETPATPSSNEAKTPAKDVPLVESVVSPEVAADPIRVAGASSQVQPLDSEESFSSHELVDSSVPGDPIIVVTPATVAESNSAASVAGADSPVTDDVNYGTPADEDAKQGGSAPSLSVRELPAGGREAGKAFDAERRDRDRGDALTAAKSPAESSASTPRGGASPSLPATRPPLPMFVAPTVPVAYPDRSESLTGSWRSPKPENRFSRPPVSVALATTLDSTTEASRAHLRKPDSAKPEAAAGPPSLVPALIAAALGVGLSSVVLLALFRSRPQSPRARDVRSSEPEPVGPESDRQPSLPELSKSDRIALDMELDEILVNPESVTLDTERSDRIARV